MSAPLPNSSGNSGNTTNNLPTHQPKAASFGGGVGGRGWFEGTMGVISGSMGKPMTPQLERRPRANSMSNGSAPNSPARFSNLIMRMPSQDSLDRSIHNESGHGKSTAQIIKDLKKANAELTDKTAKMELSFMNQLANTTQPLQESLEKEKETSKTLNRQMAVLQSQKIASDSKVGQMQEQLQKTKEESAFQRHTISDLKSQLHQLQNEVEALEDSNDDLRNQFDGEQYQQKLQSDLQKSQSNLEMVQQELLESQQTEASRVSQLEDQLKEEQERSKQAQDEHELQNELAERDQVIASLQEKLDDYAEQALNQAVQLASVKELTANQDQYRRDEAEDLRILHDAQEEEITTLRNELEKLEKELSYKKNLEQEISLLKGEEKKMADDNEMKLLQQLQDAEIALQSLDTEKEILISKHSEMVTSMDQKSAEKEEEYRQKIATKENELFLTVEQLANRQVELENSNVQVETLQQQLLESGSDNDDDMQELKSNLKDRDTTIAALVRSSVTIEGKIRDLEEQMQESHLEKEELLLERDNEIASLKNSMDASSLEIEKLQNEIVALEKDLDFAEADAKRWQQRALQQQAPTSPASNNSVSVKVRDDAIDNLVVRNLELDTANKDLKTRVGNLVKEVETASMRNKYDAPELRTEIVRLQEENDMFAEQIIEQDEELQGLVQEIRIREQSLRNLQQSNDQLETELSTLQSQGLNTTNTSWVTDGEDYDGTSFDDNKNYQLEIRELRTELWQANQEASAANDLKLELAQAHYALEEYKRTNPSQSNLKQRMQMLETQLQKYHQQDKGVQENLQVYQNDKASNEITRVESFERRTKEKENIIQTLKRDLETSKNKPSQDLQELTEQLQELESENSGLQEQFGVELSAKNQQIYALEQTLHAQEQLLFNMRQEMDQLQNGMEFATEKRRNDSDDLQQEVLYMESKAMRQEREIGNLKMHLEETKLQHRAEISKFKDQILREQQEPSQNDRNEDEMFQERLERLKQRNVTLQENNMRLGGRLERATTEIQSLNTERQLTSELEFENKNLRQQVQELKTSKPPKAPSPSHGKENPSKFKPKKFVKTGSFGGLFKKKSKQKVAARRSPPQHAQAVMNIPDDGDDDCSENDILQSSF
jgi:chromosome segregation ATPase